MLKISARPTTRLGRQISPAKASSVVIGTHHAHQVQTRNFLDSLLKSGLGECPLRNLTHTKVISKSPKTIFKAVSDVSGYPAFLPFTISSTVTSRDTNGYPTKARIRIGYEKLGLEQNWDSNVSCDPENGIVEAKSSEMGSDGMFEVLKATWNIKDNGQKQALVRLDVDVKFRNPLYDQMFTQVEGKVASTMIEAFEKRIHELDPAK